MTKESTSKSISIDQYAALTKRKRGETLPKDGEMQELLSEELREELGKEKDVILPSKRVKKPKREYMTKELLQNAKKLSKTKLKKLAQLRRKKELTAKRGDVFKGLEETKMPAKELSLLCPTSKMGHKKTMKEKVKQALLKEKMKVQLSTEERECLYPKRSIRGEGGTVGGEAGDVGGEREAVAPMPYDIFIHPKEEEQKKEAPQQPSKEGHEPQEEAEEKPKEEKEEIVAETERETETVLRTVENNKKDTLMEKLRALRQKNEAKHIVSLEKKTETTEEIVTDRYVCRPLKLPSTKDLLSQSERQNATQEGQAVLRHKNRVMVLRKPEIEEIRKQLPVCGYEQEIMEAISENPIVILCGETGSGKTTQIPQFLYEHGFANNGAVIGVTEPRRLAAISTAQRIAEELNVQLGEEVGYQIRYDAHTINETKLKVKFMTDGILLKEIQADFLLQKYSVLILDEAHERNLNTDILIGILSRIVPLRMEMAREDPSITPLKLVIMSATLRLEDFTENAMLFSFLPKKPPVIQVEARQHPVTVHFSKRTELKNYVREVYRKILYINKHLPKGGILVFLTGKYEIQQVMHLLKKYKEKKMKKLRIGQEKEKKNRRIEGEEPKEEIKEDEVQESLQGEEYIRERDDDEKEADLEESEGTNSFNWKNDEMDNDDSDSDSDAESEESRPATESLGKNVDVPNLHYLPLYSLLPKRDQLRIFEPVPSSSRLVVLATNIAETSLTIPNISYVIDCGRCKERVYDVRTGISEFQVQWIAQSNANQRAGRAGRTGPGIVYRLYSSSVFDREFPLFPQPEIACHPLQDVILSMKVMGVPEIQNFPFVSPPPRNAMKTALQFLYLIGALTTDPLDPSIEKVTPLGIFLAKFPISPRYGKMILLAKETARKMNNPAILAHMLTIVAGLCSTQSPFICTKEKEGEEGGDIAEEKTGAATPQEEPKKEKPQWYHNDSDLFSLLYAIGAYAYLQKKSGNDHTDESVRTFCTTNGLNEKLMEEIVKLRAQLVKLIRPFMSLEGQVQSPVDATSALPLTDLTVVKPPTVLEKETVREILTIGFIDHLAKRIPRKTITVGSKFQQNCGYYALNPTIAEPLYISPFSHTFTSNPKALPEFVLYQMIVRSSNPYMRNVTIAEKTHVINAVLHAPTLVYSVRFLEEPMPKYHQKKDQIVASFQLKITRQQWIISTKGMECERILTLLQGKGQREGEMDRQEKEKKETLEGLQGNWTNEESKKLTERMYRWFGTFLLNGKILPIFESIKEDIGYTEEPQIIVRQNQVRDKKIYLLLEQLKEKQIVTKKKLIKEWKKNPLYLYEEIALWIKPIGRMKFKNLWKEIVKEEEEEENEEQKEIKMQ